MDESIHRWAQLDITFPLLVPIVHERINSQVGTVEHNIPSLSAYSAWTNQFTGGHSWKKTFLSWLKVFFLKSRNCFGKPNSRKNSLIIFYKTTAVSAQILVFK